jgi:hypothetical protein
MWLGQNSLSSRLTFCRLRLTCNLSTDGEKCCRCRSVVSQSDGARAPIFFFHFKSFRRTLASRGTRGTHTRKSHISAKQKKGSISWISAYLGGVYPQQLVVCNVQYNFQVGLNNPRPRERPGTSGAIVGSVPSARTVRMRSGRS